MGKWIELILKLLALFTGKKKAPEDIADEVEKEVVDTSLDDDIDDINRELRDRT